MPQIAALTINDGAASPVAHTFNPNTTNGAKAEWADRSPGLPNAFLTISHEIRRPTQPGGAQRLIVGFNFPVKATVNGVDTVVRNSSAQVTLNYAPDSTLSERKDALAYVTNFLSNASVKTSSENVEPFW